MLNSKKLVAIFYRASSAAIFDFKMAAIFWKYLNFLSFAEEIAVF